MAWPVRRNQNFWQQILICAAATAAFGCSEPKQAKAVSTDNLPSTSPDWVWQKAPDESFVNSDTTHLAEQFGSIRRCWKRPTGYDCLYVGVTGPTFRAKRYQIDVLNKGYGDDKSLASFDGYGCRFYNRNQIVEETLGKRSNTLATNTVTLSGSLPNSTPWTAKYVDDYLIENDIGATGTHFDCTELAAAVLNGSLMTAATTSVRYSQLMH